MFTRIRNRRNVRIIFSLSFVMAFLIGVYTYIDIRNMQLDTIRTSEQALGVFAAAIKGSVNASMKSGHHEDVKQILDEVNRQSFVDRVLIFNEEARGPDTIAGFGGEAFVVVMPATDLEGVAHKAEALGRTTEAKECAGADTLIPRTISIGVATYASGSPGGLINAADQALYRAKQSGRNKVVVSGPEIEVTEA